MEKETNGIYLEREGSDKSRHSFRYAVIGAVFGLGSPIGLMFLRALMTSSQGTWGWLGHEMQVFGWVYLYTGWGTVIAFSLLGFAIGHQTDVLDKRLEHAEISSRELRRLSNTDGLTNVLTRRALIEQIHRELKRAARQNYPVARLFVDVDNLKNMNDEFGHMIGDEALVSVADIIQAVVRETDVAGRYGGDEFVIFLSRTDAEQSLSVAERIRHGVEDIRHLTTGDDSIHLSVSLGVYSPASVHGSPAVFMKKADEALQESKKKGKNICVVKTT